MAEVKAIGEEVDAKEKQRDEVKLQVDTKLGKIGNLVDDSVPIGQDEDTGNKVTKKIYIYTEFTSKS